MAFGSMVHDVDAPTSLGDGNEYDLAMRLRVYYRVECNGCGTAELGIACEVEPESVAIEVAGIAMPIDDETANRIVRSWLAVHDLSKDICEHWNEHGRHDRRAG